MFCEVQLLKYLLSISFQVLCLTQLETLCDIILKNYIQRGRGHFRNGINMPSRTESIQQKKASEINILVTKLRFGTLVK